MESRKIVLRQTLWIAAGQIICTAATIGVFLLLGKYDISVLLGGIVGAVIATVNFFLMSLFATLAADKAEAQDITGGKKLIQLSYMGRILGLFLVLFLCAKSGLFHVLTLAIPLVFNRPILTVSELIQKKGGKKL